MNDKMNVCPHDLCTACAACVNICNQGAIAMQNDELGYQYPQIDIFRCVDCGLCRKVCPVLHPVVLHETTKVYAMVSKDKLEHITSSSGGVASVISRYLLEQGGIVYGCLEKNYLDISHVRVACTNELELLKGSKYVQSNIGLCYRSIKKDLQDNKLVLFIGTPCQVAGLKCFLQKEYENLYTIDLVCHGVAPQQVLREDVEKNGMPKGLEKSEQIYIKFRWKTKHRIQFGIQLWRIEDSMKLLKSTRFPYNPYITAFMTGLSFRENCHQCVYAKSSRMGDLTVGDFWGLGSLDKTMIKSKEGVSLLLVNTNKGREILRSVAGRFILEERSLVEAMRGNANLRMPSPRPANKDLFKKILKERGLNAACHAALSRSQYYRLVIIEELKRISFLVTMFKKLRLFINLRK